MKKCQWDINSQEDVRNQYGSIFGSLSMMKAPIDTVKKVVAETIKQDTKNFNIKTPQDKGKLASIIYAQADKYGYLLQSSFFLLPNIFGLIEASKSKTQKVDRFLVSTDTIENIDTVNSVLDSNVRFIDQAFKMAKDVKTHFIQKANEHIFDTLFVNRGSIDLTDLGLVHPEHLNESIRVYQTYLFDQIVAYLEDLKSTLSEAQAKQIDDLINYKFEDEHTERIEMYYDTGQGVIYSGAYERITPLINTYLSLSDEARNTTYLRELFKKATDTESINTRSKLELNALEARMMLEHFDDMLISVTNNNVLIRESHNAFSSEDKYSLSEATANLATTWRTSDNINVEKEADFVTKLAVKTSKLYRFGTDLRIGDLYLKFSDFEHTIAKIKDLLYDPNTYDIIFDLEYRANYSSTWNSLSRETQLFLQNKSLADAIAQIRLDPVKNLHCIFEVLSNNRFRSNNALTLYAGFNQDELNKLHSINKAIFSAEPLSIRMLTDVKARTDFYAYLTETCDSIFSIKYLQYYRDDRGEIKLRTFLNMSLDNILRQIELTINIGGSEELIGDYDAELEKISLKPLDSEDDKITGITYTIPGTDIKVTVETNTGAVTYSRNGQVFNDFRSLVNNSDIDLFTEKYLKLGLTINPTLYNNVVELIKDKSLLVQNLLNATSRVLLNQYIGIKYINNLPVREIDSALSNTYGKSYPAYDYALSALKLVHPTDFPFLYQVSLAKANMLGTTTASVVKDSQGNSQSRQSLSRLLGSHHTQESVLEKMSNSPTRDLLILESGVLEGVFTVKEFYDLAAGSKESTQNTVAEMAQMSFLYDFIGGLHNFEDSKRRVVGDGHIALYPSVNSDKNTIGRLLINMGVRLKYRDADGNVILDKNGLPKYYTLSELTPERLKGLIQIEMGRVYGRMMDNVLSDYGKLFSWAVGKGFDVGNVTATSFDGLLNFCKTNNILRVVNSIATSLNTKAATVTNPVEFLKELVRLYNYEHRSENDRIQLVDLIHFIDKGGIPTHNVTIQANIFRNNPAKAEALKIPASMFTGKDGIIRDSNYFWKRKSREVVKSLLKSRFKLNTTNTNQPELADIRNSLLLKGGNENSPNKWITASGDMALAKVTYNNKTVYITSYNDIIRLFGDYSFQEKVKTVDGEIVVESTLFTSPLTKNLNRFLDDPNVLMELNPLLDHYNTLDYLITQEWMLTTVGTFAGHPIKGEPADELEAEAAQFLAQHKRNVSFTAAMHAFQLNTLHGVPDTYNIATIEDIEDFNGVIDGSHIKVKPFDGATFVNPFMVVLENMSLEGSKAGISKKQFVHFKNPNVATGGIIKTAGFGLTNDWIRNSKFLQRMMMKMTSGKWMDLLGRSTVVNICKDYEDLDIIYNDIFYKEGDNLYKIELIKSLGNNQYSYVKSRVDTNGLVIDLVEAEPITITSNYELWNFFGGMNSMTLNEKGVLEWSNTSVDNVVIAMNNVSHERATSPQSQSDVYQTLKHSDVHYLATIGAVKQGAANINPRSRYDDDIPYDYQTVKMLQAGIQLDKEHHADEAEISLMTLVISACSSLGYNFEQATHLYNALKVSAETGLHDHLAAMDKLVKTNDGGDIQELMVNSIIETLANAQGSNGNFAQKLAENILNKIKSGEKVSLRDNSLPLSDNTVYAKMFSAVTVFLTNSGIKLKIPGLLAVLTPSYNIFKLHGDRKLESFKDELELIDYQKTITPVWEASNPESSIVDVELERTYNILYTDGTERLYYVLSPDELYALEEMVKPKEAMVDNLGLPVTVEYNDKLYNVRADATVVDIMDYYDPVTDTFEPIPESDILYDSSTGAYRVLNENALINDIVSITENVIVGRNLGAYNVRAVGTTNEGESVKFQIWNLDSAKGLWKLRKILGNKKTPDLEKAIQLQALASEFGLNIEPKLKHSKYVENQIRRKLQLDVRNLSNTQTSPIQQLNDVLKLETNSQEYYRRFAAYANILLNRLDGTRFKGANDPEPMTINANTYPAVKAEVIKLLEEAGKVRVNGKSLTIDRDSIQIQPYERIMPKTFASAFSLNEFDSVSDIVNDPDFFVKQYGRNNRVLVQPRNYSIALKRSSGKHIYLLDSHLLHTADSELRRIFPKYTEQEGRILRLNEDNEIMYEMYEGDLIYVDQAGNEIIVTENIIDYINDLSYDGIQLSQSMDDHMRDYWNVSGVEPLSPMVKVDGVWRRRTPEEIKTNEELRKITPWTELREALKDSKSRAARDFYNYIVDEYSAKPLRDEFISRTQMSYENIDRLTNDSELFAAVRLSHEYNRFNEYNYRDYPNHPAWKTGREKHTSFIKSLDVVGSRTPSLSMLSFMAERTVAFDNPNINTAHVSTYQVLLQGSDYDVDAVSTETYDIDPNGMLLLWSPYGNKENVDNLNASLELPMPTGKEIDRITKFAITARVDNWDGLNMLFSNYGQFITILPIINNQNQADLERISLTIDNTTSEGIKAVGQLLEIIPNLEIPNEALLSKINQTLKSEGFINFDLTYDQVLDLYIKLCNFVDRHNTFFSKMSRTKINRAINNNIMHNVYLISQDPSNIQQAHSSVDVNTGPLKDKGNTADSALEARQRTPGNVINKFESLEENMVGKRGISIAAVGLKSFFALTNYNNAVLNSGDSELQKTILLGKDGLGVLGHRTLANIRAKNVSTITNDDVLKALAETDNDTDAALVLSAILSLATDNAKELQLAKLNAGTKTLGIYLYGVAIGMQFDEIADVMMSPVAQVLTEISNQNVLTGESGYNNFDGNIFDYFEEGGPWRELKRFRVNRDLDGNSINDPVSSIEEKFKSLLPLEMYTKDDLTLGLAGILQRVGTSETSLKSKLATFTVIRNSISNGNSFYREKCFQLCDFCENYLRLAHIMHSLNEIYNTIKIMAKGAAEMKRLGLLLNLNQGLKSKEEDLVKQIQNFTRALIAADPQGNEKEEINLRDFAFNAAKRKYYVDKYEQYKHTFNILAVIANSPHYMIYVQALATALAQLEQSFRFRNVFKHTSQLREQTRIREDKITKGYSTFLMDHLRRKWMQLYNNGEGIVITIPAGNKAYDQFGNLVTLKWDTPVKLGTEWGDATFRRWMESQVIPNLKEGRADAGKIVTDVLENPFIRDLQWDLSNRTTGHNSQIVATLPINMLPREDSERALLNNYITAFNNLSKHYYNYKVRGFRNNKPVDKTEHVPVADLFIYYAMIANQWKLGEKSLVPIFEDFLNLGKIENFHNFVSRVDRNDLSDEERKSIGINPDGYLNIDTHFNTIITYIALNENPWTATSKYIFAKDPETKKRILRQKKDKSDNYGNEYEDFDPGLNESFDFEEFEDYQMYVSGKNENPNDYVDITTVDLNQFPSNTIEITAGNINYKTAYTNSDGELRLVSVEHDIDGWVRKIEVNGQEIDMNGITIVFDKAREVQIQMLLEACIESKLNPC